MKTEAGLKIEDKTAERNALKKEKAIQGALVMVDELCDERIQIASDWSNKYNQPFELGLERAQSWLTDKLVREPELTDAIYFLIAARQYEKLSVEDVAIKTWEAWMTEHPNQSLLLKYGR